jgi:hypothetical protein
VILTGSARLGGYVVSAWLLGVAANLVAAGLYDVAVRDVVMSLAAFTLARLAEVREEVPAMGPRASPRGRVRGSQPEQRHIWWFSPTSDCEGGSLRLVYKAIGCGMGEPVPGVRSNGSIEGSRARRLARLILVAFLFTFMAARVLVFLIVSRRIPDVYLNLGGTHVHHLNYGIFLLSAVGAYLLLVHPGPRSLRWVAVFYGIGLALTFDEFGLWLHLGGSYWQRASFDAVVVIAALLSLAAVAPTWAQFRPHHWAAAAMLAGAVTVFGYLLVDSLRYADRLLLRIQTVEESQPPLR